MIAWVFFGIIHLLILSYQDVFKKQWVDDRHNWFMYGATASLYALYMPKIWIIILILAIAFGLGYLLTKLKYIGEADAKTITWIFTGFAIIGIDLLAVYAAVFLILYLFQALVNQMFYRLILKKEPVNFPAYPLFLSSFSLVGILFM